MALAIMCSGGDAPGMNPAIKHFVDILYRRGEVPYFIDDGLEGLIDGKIRLAVHQDVAGILHEGGTIIRSSRSKRFFDPVHRRTAYDNLVAFGIEGIVILGGDGSFRAMQQLCLEFPVRAVGVPATIDNDIAGSDYALGVDTALNVIRDAIDKIRDTASSFSRAFVVEVMGRECGYLAAVSAIVTGAEICVIPEVPFAKEKIERKLKAEVAQGRGYVLALVAEGTKKSEEVRSWLEECVGFESRITVLGHIQRGGNPTVYDRLMAFEFVACAIDTLLGTPEVRHVTVSQRGSVRAVPIADVVNGIYELPEKYRTAVLSIGV